MLKQGSYLEGLCKFDAEPIRRALDAEIKTIEDEIERGKLSSEERMRDSLA
jgi:hypothetical protein